MGKVTRALRWARHSWPLVTVLIVAIAAFALLPVFTRPPSDLGVKAKPLINQLIYPTFGNPAIVKKGTNLTIEFDPRDRHFDDKLARVKKFTVVAQTADGLYPIGVRMPVQSSKVGTSTQWPEYGHISGQDRRIYLVTVQVPQALQVDLYNLTVDALYTNNQDVVDQQPHCLQAVDDYKDHFSFIQLTDIHIWGPENLNVSGSLHDRSGRPDGTDPTRKGAVYYQKAIDQINTIKPDFCVFTGDFMYGQSYFLQDQGSLWGLTTEYEYEMLWFYQETMRLNVPVFLTTGNHDSFAEGKTEGAHEDWLQNWRCLFGPLYHSFDYGDYHFLALNAQDWPVFDRTLVDLNVSIQSPKYKGEFSGGGDKWEAGVTPDSIAKVDESKFTGQLRWMRDDLAAHQGSKMRVVATHQDPWRKAGSGTMWSSTGSDSAGFFGSFKTAMGFGGKYGNGDGRLAAIKLMAQYKVALELSGHFHSDFLEVFPWLDGTGQCICANTTCVQFNVDGLSRSYPGYRRIWVNNGKVESVNYADPAWSYPLYAGTNVGGLTDLSKLEAPAVATAFNPQPGSATDVTLNIQNALAKPLPGAYAEFPMPYLSGGRYYKITGGTITQARDSLGNAAGVLDHRVFYVRTNLGPVEARNVRLVESDVPDKIAPSGSVTINGGAVGVAGLGATLSLSANDSGSGVKDMMISNTPDFDGAQWEPYAGSVPWSLASGPAGPRTVYVKFRDYAMDPNVSDAVAASINVAGL